MWFRPVGSVIQTMILVVLGGKVTMEQQRVEQISNASP
jgi:hypothetical protein